MIPYCTGLGRYGSGTTEPDSSTPHILHNILLYNDSGIVIGPVPGKPGKKSSAYPALIRLNRLCDTSSFVPVANPMCNTVSFALIFSYELYSANALGNSGAK